MAQVYRKVKGRPIQEFIAMNDGVQFDLETRTFEMAVRAEETLLEHRLEGHAEIEIDHGDIDWYVTLSDERGQKAALSIEYGRAGYVDEYGVEYGEMEGLFILADATHLPKRRKAKVKLPRARPSRRSDGRFR